MTLDFKPKFLSVIKNYDRKTFTADLMAGVIVGIVALPLAIAFGIASGVSPEKGIITAIVAGLTISLFGGSRVQIGGPTGAFIVIVYGIIQQYGIQGLTIATLMAGVFLILLGVLRLGTIIKYIPYPIVVGFTSGIAVTIFTTQVKDLLGMQMDHVPSDFIEKWGAYIYHIGSIDLWSTLVGIVSVIIIAVMPRFSKKVPGSLVAIIVMTIAVLLLKQYAGVTSIETIGDRFSINSTLPGVVVPEMSWEIIKGLVGPAVTIAVLGAIESLLSATVADGVIGDHHNSNTELIGQGIANMVSPLFGGIPATGAIARTMTNINNGGRTPIAGIVHAAVLLLIFLFLMPLAQYIPMACLAGVLVVVSYGMSGWRSFLAMSRNNPKSDVTVLSLTFFLTIIFDLTVAIEFGLILASLLFMRRMAETTDIHAVLNEIDLNEDADIQAGNLEHLTIPPNVEVYEINGPYFFGAGNRFEDIMVRFGNKPKVRIIRMRKVPFIDSTGLHNLENMCRISQKEGITIVLSGVNPKVEEVLKRNHFEQLLGKENICNHIDLALARAREIAEQKVPKRKKIPYMILTLLLLVMGSQKTIAQQQSTDDIKQMTAEMYQYFCAGETEKFFNTTERLKTAALAAGDERIFYRAWSEQALYTFKNIQQKEGIAIARDISQYVRDNGSKFGLYAANYVFGVEQSATGNMNLAERSFRQAIELRHQYFPKESAAAAYLGLCEIELNRRRLPKVLDYARKALAEPGIIPMHQITAWAYKCFVRYHQGDSLTFEKDYKEHQKLVEKYGLQSEFGELINFYHAVNGKQWQTAFKLADKMTPQTKAQSISSIYEHLGDYQQALSWYKKYKLMGDSIYSYEVRSQLSELDDELKLAHAENESKNLLLANQKLKLARAADELKQHELEVEAAALKLENANIELANAVIKMENDSLERSQNQAKLKEYHMRMEAQKRAEQARNLALYDGYIIIGIILLCLGLMAYRRRCQVKRLQEVNQQLQVAYDQLAKTKAAKEYFESELRIARVIQMSMVPHDFPQRPDMDMYAMMTPAKEVGGDLYNYLLQDDHLLYFCVGDVSGKGIPASLFMAQVTRMFYFLADGRKMPHEIATRLNDALTERNEQGMFVTMFIGLIDLKTGHLDFCNAGHNPPLLNGEFMEMESNAPIGLWQDLEFVGEEIEDLHGKTLFVYTDGLNEAENIYQEQFGDERLQELLTHDYDTAQQTAEAVHQAVQDFVGEAEPSDDLTKMCIKL